MRPLIPALLLLAACGPSSPPPTGASTGSSDRVQVISKGAAFTSKDYLVPGHVSLLYFYADW